MMLRPRLELKREELATSGFVEEALEGRVLVLEREGSSEESLLVRMEDFADLIDLCFEEERESGGSCTVYCNMKIWAME